MRGRTGQRYGHSCGRIALAGCLAIAPCVPAQAQVLPSGGNVVSGSASITSTGSASTLIVQQSAKAVINWQDFSISSGANVTFRQPDATAITLNRVTGAGASAINGNLLANGQVWLVNGNGILMGAGSRIDVGGLIATTSDITDSDFLSGHYAFARPSGNPNASVVNRGSISAATGGSAVLSGGHVANEGLIQARLGHVVLGGASAFSVSFDGDSLIQYQITTPVSETPKDADGKPVAALVSNSGTIAAQGGQVLLTARAARNVVDNVINMTGIIQAQSASVRNGEVVLDAGDGGAVTVSGTVDVSGRQAGNSGGTLALVGEKIAVADGVRLDASGDSGGGQILIGGSGAQSVTVGKAVVAADTTGSGKGGTVAILSGGKTSVAASISAKGIAEGGQVETSGHVLNILDGARVDTSAESGATGLWLLDPVDVVIDSPAAANIMASLVGTNVSVTASNDITVSASISYSSANSLTLLAGHDLVVNANVQNAGSGNILAVAGWDGTTAASSILATPGAYGNSGGRVVIANGLAGNGSSLGSRNGTTSVAAGDLILAANSNYAQLGYHGGSTNLISTQGAIDIVLNGGLVLTGGSAVSSSFAQIGHDGPLLGGSITVRAQGPVNMTGGAALQSYAQIGNGELNGGAISGNVLVTSGADIRLGSNAGIRAGGAGAVIVLAAAGDFTNQAGAGAFDVSGGGRWLVFLNSPADNLPGGLNGSPFYNRAFDFSTDSYAPVTSTGSRFVYALAPTVTVTADNAAKVYGTANPALSATITGGLAGDAPAGVFSGSPVLATAAAAHSAAGSYPILASLGTLTSDYNYAFQFVSGTLQINAAALTASLTGTVRKTYDGTATASPGASNYNLAGVIGGDVVTLSPGTAAYSDKNAGSGKTVTVNGLSLVGPNSGNYILTSSVLSAAIGIIDAATLTASLTGTVRKTYDGTATASPGASNYNLAGLFAGDSVTISSAAAAYGDKNVGPGKTVTVNGLSLAGPDSGNYALTSSVLSAAIGIIDAATLTASLTGTVRKTYDGTATASLGASNYNLAGLVGGDAVTLIPGAAAYNDKNAGSGKTITANGLGLSGADKGNYILASASTSAAIGIIDAATLTASLTGTVRKTYDGTAAASLSASNYNLAGVIGGDAVTLTPSAAAYNDKNAGSGKTVTASGLGLSGADKGNYILASSVLSAAIGAIDAATVTASLTGTVRKTYDGTATANLSASNYNLAGAAAGDNVTLTSTATYNDKNTGTAKTITANGLGLSGADKGNYVLISSTLSAAIGTIDAATLAASLTGTVRKTYDGTAAASLGASNYNLAGIIGGDAVTLIPGVATYNDKNAGSGKTVTANGLGLSGADRGNYLLASTGISAAIGIIDPASVSASVVGTVQKPFDGTVAATLNLSNYNLTGVASGDSVTLNNPVAGLYDSQTVGGGKTVTVTGLSLLGSDNGNYVLAASTVSGVVGVITVAPIGLLGNSFTSNGISISSPGQFPSRGGANGPAQGPSDATSDTGANGDSAQSDGAALSLGNSLGGSAQSSSAVLLEGLLRQITPSPGGPTRSVPPYGQIFSSWGNEAFWQ
jgi:filamentous hemagglutinin family protein